MNRRRQGQMEMAGLVIIVIMLTLGMLFFAIFTFKEGTEKKIFTREELAYSTISALVKTSVENGVCENNFQPHLGQELLEDCVQNYINSPEGYSQYRCNNRHSCVFLEETIADLLRTTLGAWHKRYQFRSTLLRSESSEPEEIINIVSEKGDCPETRERDSSSIPFRVRNAGLVESVLHICD